MTEPSTVLQLRRRKQPAAPPVLMRACEIAERLKVSESHIRRLTQNGEIPHVRLGDKSGSPVRYPIAAVDEWWQKRLEGGRL